MRNLSGIISLLALGLLIFTFVLSPVQADLGWSLPSQLTTNTAFDEFPSISDDGTKIVYQSTVDDDNEIFVINSDGSVLTQLTSNIDTDVHPSINGDGTKIAFASTVDGDWEISVISQVFTSTPVEYHDVVIGQTTMLSRPAAIQPYQNLLSTKPLVESNLMWMELMEQLVSATSQFQQS